MRSPSTLFAAVPALLVATFTATASVSAQSTLQQEYVPEESTTGEEPEGSGWTGVLDLGGSVQISDNTSFIGQPDGTAWTVGFTLTGNAEYNQASHEWRTMLSIAETFARTPVLSEFVKTTDSLQLESIYFFHVPHAEWFGPFGRLRLETSIFKGFDVRPSDVTYTVTRADGLIDDKIDDRARLTSAFAPLLVKESIGAFARPISGSLIDIDLRIGAGARQVFAEGELVLADDSATADIIELRELQSYQQMGAEGTLEARGGVRDGDITYTAGAEMMIPFVNSLSDDDRSAMDLTNYELGLTASFKLLDWASLDYQFRALKLPALLDEWQMQNNLLLTFRARLAEVSAE